MARRIAAIVFCIIMFGVNDIEMVPDTLKQMATTFLKEMEACKVELGIKDSILGEVYRLWKQEYDGVTRETGCLLNCMSKKLAIFEMDGKFHHGKAKDFAMNHGADEQLAAQVVTLVHDCEKGLVETSDECLRTLELTKCVRGNIGHIKWTPKVEILVGEVIGEE